MPPYKILDALTSRYALCYNWCMGIWLVGYQDDKWWAANRSPIIPPMSSADTFQAAWNGAMHEAQLLMLKHPIKSDISKARIVSDYRVGFGMPFLQAPTYVDYSDTRKTPDFVVVLEAPTRYQAIKAARLSREASMLPPASHST